MLEKLSSFVELARRKKPKIVAVAAAEDSHALEAIKWIRNDGLAEAILIGCRDKITSLAENLKFDISHTEIVDIPDKAEACKEAVRVVKSGQAHILMKGLVDSAIYLRAILNKETGIAASRPVTQLAFIESPHYHKLFAITDAGITITPDQRDKATMIAQSVNVLHQVGIAVPKVALIAAVEHITPAITATVDAAALSGITYDNCLVEGPLSIDLAFNKDSCRHKGLHSQVGGDIDLVVLPDINSANVFYKTVMQLGGALSASTLTGTSKPVVFTSRSDTAKTKYFAIACAISQCKD